MSDEINSHISLMLTLQKFSSKGKLWPAKKIYTTRFQQPKTGLAKKSIN